MHEIDESLKHCCYVLRAYAGGASSAIVAASDDGDTSSIANALSLSFAFGYAVPAARATAQAIQAGSAFTCSNSAAAAYISALSNAIAIGNTEAAAQAVFAAFTLGWYASQTHPCSIICHIVLQD